MLIRQDQGQLGDQGYCKLGGDLVSWKRKKQPIFIQVNSEAENRAMADGICESLWLNTLFQELAFKHNGLTTLHYDTISVLYFAKNPIYHEHTKHTDLDCHFIRKEIKRKEI